ncbi:potassium channel family protein [Paenibacillus tarimensis]
MMFFNKLFYRLLKLNNVLVFVASALLIAVCSMLIYLIEPETFEHPFNGFWWVMTTVTTVGYGDYYPHTVAGKFVGIFLYIFGIGLISIVISKVIDAIVVYKRLKEEGKLTYKGENHFVIIDWSKEADLAAQEIMKSNPAADIVLIDRLEKSPAEHERIHYVQGNPVNKETLDKANLEKAKAVFIFANETTEFGNYIRDNSFVDGKTLLIATSIERFYKHVYTIVEIKDKNNIDNFKHANVDEFLLGSEMISQLAVRSAINPGASKIFSQLLTHQYGEDLFEITAKPHWSTYRDAFTELLQQGATLISDGEKMDINRRLDETIAPSARLFVICDKMTYAKLKTF